MLVTSMTLVCGIFITHVQAQPPACPSNIGIEPGSMDQYPFVSTLLQIFPWLGTSCDNGYVSAVTLSVNPYVWKPRRFFLATFVVLQMGKDQYFKLVKHVPVDVISHSSGPIVKQDITGEKLEFQRNLVFGIFYEKWDMSEEDAVVRHSRLGLRNESSNQYQTFVGFFGREEVEQIEAFRVEQDVRLTSHYRIPSMSIQVDYIPVMPSCPAPPLVDHSTIVRITFNDTSKVGDSIEYQCSPGYQFTINSSKSITCTEPGPVWSTSPVCESSFRSCGSAVPNIENGYVAEKLFQGLSQVGDAILYACRSGFIMTGSYKIVCLDNRPKPGWSELPLCLRHSDLHSNHSATTTTTTAATTDSRLVCRFPELSIPNGYVLTRTFTSVPATPTDRVSFACFKGFRLISNSEFGAETVCTYRGTWTAFPSCVEVKSKCEGFPHVENAYIYWLSFSIGRHAEQGDVIRYQCKYNFKFLSSSYSTCLHTGKWSVGYVRCMPDELSTQAFTTNMPPGSSQSTPLRCGGPPPLANTNISESSWSQNQRPSQFGDFVYYSCHRPFSTTGLTKAVCLADGSWALTLNCIHKRQLKKFTNYNSAWPNTCGPLPKFRNVIEINRSFSPDHASRAGDFAAYRCSDPHAEFQGRRTVFCMADGTWSVAFDCN